MTLPSGIPGLVQRTTRQRLAFSRTCDLNDYPGCRSVSEWQQQLAEATWRSWVPATDRAAANLTINWSDVPFTGFGPKSSDPYAEVITDPIAVVFALCVLDRIDAPLHFLRHWAGRLQPGGLLFCTFAYWNAQGPDEAIGHDVRRRIYDRDGVLKLIKEIRRFDLTVFGVIDWRYHGHTLGDHTLASLALTTGKKGL